MKSKLFFMFYVFLLQGLRSSNEVAIPNQSCFCIVKNFVNKIFSRCFGFFHIEEPVIFTNVDNVLSETDRDEDLDVQDALNFVLPFIDSYSSLESKDNDSDSSLELNENYLDREPLYKKLKCIKYDVSSISTLELPPAITHSNDGFEDK